MKFVPAILFALATVSGTTAIASDAPIASGFGATAELRTGAMLHSADGKRLGMIDRLDRKADGSVEAASIILDGRVVHVPASTISAQDPKHLVTSMSFNAVNSL